MMLLRISINILIKISNTNEVNEVYLESAKLKINNIHWDNIGTTSTDEDYKLGYEFLRRLALFLKRNS